jgi:polyisoprenyl-phosphate glycosyltransferase
MSNPPSLAPAVGASLAAAASHQLGREMPLTVSTVTPVYRGARYLPDLVRELDTLRAKWTSEGAPLRLIESIFVIDAAVDDSHAVLRSLQPVYPWLKVICLSRNFGQHAATVAGICHTSSDWVVTLDEDLQHRPSQIDALFRQQIQTGADVVYAQPRRHVHGGGWRDWSSRTIKRLLSWLTSTPEIELFNSYRLVRGGIARSAASSSSSQTYLDIALTWFTNRFDSVEQDLRDVRFIEDSVSGYGFLKLIQHARRLVISSQVDIASSGLTLGVAAIGLAVGLGLWVLVRSLLFPGEFGIRGWASTITVISFFSGVIISIACIALEYLHILAVNQLGKPTFFTVDRDQDAVLVQWFQGSGSS